MEMNDLYLINGEARARTRTLSVEQNYDKWYEFSGEQDLPLADLDVILMRKFSFDTEFIYATYILERAEDKGTLIVNKPQSLRDITEKLFTAWFADLDARNSGHPQQGAAESLLEKHGDIILKPLDGMGGSSLFRVKEGDPNLPVIAETLTDLGSRCTTWRRTICRPSRTVISACWSSTASRFPGAWRVFRRAERRAATWPPAVAAKPVR